MSQPKLTGPSLLDPSSLRGRTFREVLCGSSRVEGIIREGVNGSRNGAPDESSGVDSRRWNVVKSVALTSSGDNLAQKQKRGYGSRVEGQLPLGEVPKAEMNSELRRSERVGTVVSEDDKV